MTETANPSLVVRELPPNFMLLHGAHDSFERGACLMEAVAYVAGEEHSDHPACASRILAAIGRALNDRFDGDAARAVCREIRAEARRRKPAYAYAYAYADADAADAADAAADAAAAAALSPEERARIRATARRPIAEASIRAFERAIAITA